MNMRIWLIGAVSVGLVACGGSDANVEVVNLNKVLEVMNKTMDKMQKEVAASGDSKVNKDDPAVRKAFMEKFNLEFAKDLNDAKIMSTPIGTEVKNDGAIEGFADLNKNMKQELGQGEKSLFKVEIDGPRNRLIATDLQNGYRRDSGFSAGGFLTGMLIGHLLGQQRSAGVSPNKHANTKMSPSGYHSQAVSNAKASASARSSSSSGSFSRGK